MTTLLTLFVWLIGTASCLVGVFVFGKWVDGLDEKRMARDIRETAETLERLGG